MGGSGTSILRGEPGSGGASILRGDGAGLAGGSTVGRGESGGWVASILRGDVAGLAGMSIVGRGESGGWGASIRRGEMRTSVASTLRGEGAMAGASTNATCGRGDSGGGASCCCCCCRLGDGGTAGDGLGGDGRGEESSASGDCITCINHGLTIKTLHQRPLRRRSDSLIGHWEGSATDETCCSPAAAAEAPGWARRARGRRG